MALALTLAAAPYAPGRRDPQEEEVPYVGCRTAPCRLTILLSIIFNAMISHCFMPCTLTDSYIYPIIKNKNKSSSDKNNYRPISILSCISKLFEHVLYPHIERAAFLTDNQFGFRKKLGTELCIYLLKDTVHRFTSRGTPVFVAFLDASKGLIALTT